MTLSIKNGGYAFLIRLDLILYLSLSKELQLSHILNYYDLYKYQLLWLLWFTQLFIQSFIQLCNYYDLYKYH